MSRRRSRSTEPSRIRSATEVWRGLRDLAREVAAQERDLAAPLGLSLVQAQALLALDEIGPVSMQGLADRLCIAPSTTTRLVDQIEKKGWIRRLPDRQDRRRTLLELSESGRAMAEELSGIGLQRSWEMIGRLEAPGETGRVLEELLEDLRRQRDRGEDGLT